MRAKPPHQPVQCESRNRTSLRAAAAPWPFDKTRFRSRRSTPASFAELAHLGGLTGRDSQAPSADPLLKRVGLATRTLGPACGGRTRRERSADGDETAKALSGTLTGILRDTKAMNMRADRWMVRCYADQCYGYCNQSSVNTNRKSAQRAL